MAGVVLQSYGVNLVVFVFIRSGFLFLFFFLDVEMDLRFVRECRRSLVFACCFGGLWCSNSVVVFFVGN